MLAWDDQSELESWSLCTEVEVEVEEEVRESCRKASDACLALRPSPAIFLRTDDFFRVPFFFNVVIVRSKDSSLVALVSSSKISAISYSFSDGLVAARGGDGGGGGDEEKPSSKKVVMGMNCAAKSSLTNRELSK